MFTNTDFVKLMYTNGVWFQSLKPFMADKRLTEPMAIFGHDDCTRCFDGCEVYPDALAEVAYNNGF